MQLILEVRTEGSADRRIQLCAGQSIEVGRTDRAGFVVAYDEQMSALHFAVQCAEAECRLCDLNSTNGTILKGERIAEATLRDGDEFVAGQTHFLVRVVGGADPATPSPSAPPAVPHDEEEVVPPAPSPPLKKVDVEVCSGTSRGRKFWLLAGQRLCVGRTESADVVIADDEMLSGKHFVLECDARCCRIRDLNSSNGTVLNGMGVGEAVLCDGDEIVAGQTQFAVRVEGGPPATHRSVQPLPPQAGREHATAVPTVQASLAAAQGFRYSVYRCHSKLRLYRGSEMQFDPAAISRRLARVAPMYLVLNPAQCDLVTPDQAPSPEPLAATPEIDDASFPVLCAADERLNLSSMLAQAWGNDAAVGVYWRQQRATLLERLRSFVSTCQQDPATQPLAQLYPSVLADWLANSDAGAVASLMSGCDAILVEVHGGERWSVFGAGDVEATLRQLGFVPTPVWEA